MNLTNDFKRVLSGMLSVAMTATLVQSFPAIAEDAQTTKYPYAVFASSDIEGAITVNAGNFCVNGNVATNGTIVASGNMNINGTKTENAGEDMIYIFDKIDSAYFSKSNVNQYSDDYILEEMNINITTPTEIMGEATLTGNININTALKAFENVNLYGEVKNTNDSVIFSKYGDIVIDSQNVNLNGLVYAPFGNVVVTAQNLNLNNVVIIADTITFNCPNVNANYSSSVAEFVGTVSDLLDIPYDEWQYMKDENENDFPDFFEDFDNWSNLKDTDGDKLPDCVEQYIGSDSTLADTDGDALDDFYELFVTYTEPAKNDTDDNGILDCDEDFDKDDLSNLKEYLASTSPWDDDTDSDTLKDGEEIDTYGTDPLKPDTDDDGLEDSDEIHLGTDPVNPDTDSDGILDGYEKFYQTYTHIVENEDCVVSEVIVSLEGTGNLQKNTTVKSVMNKDVLCTNVAGLVGEPFNIETSSQFDTATITFKIDKSKLGDTEFDNLMFLWYDEENNEFIELETVLDEPNSTVSVVTTHFSNYMLVDQDEWFDAWKRASDISKGRHVPLATAICYDCSGSMSSNDPKFNYNVYDENGSVVFSYLTCYRKLAITNYIESMSSSDITALISFESTASLVRSFTNNQSELLTAVNPYNSGGTNADAAVSLALEQLETNASGYSKHIILLSDGDVNVAQANLNKAIEDNVKIHTIGLGSGANNSVLKYYAEETGGDFFATTTAAELATIYKYLSLENHFDLVNMPDDDADGLPDEFEVSGLILSNGQIFYTNPTNSDCDDDGLLDGEEISTEVEFVIKKDNRGGSIEYEAIVFKYNCDPWQIDTDKDGIDDCAETKGVTYESPNGTVDEYEGDPLNKGLADGIIGQLVIVSHNEPIFPDGGHSFLIYQSYVNDDLDFTDFEAGYIYDKNVQSDKWISVSPQKYSILPGKYVTIGNFNYGGNGSSGTLGFLGGSSGSASSGGGGSSSGSSGASSSGSSGGNSSSGSSNNSNGATAGVHFNIEFNVIYDENFDYNDNKAIEHSVTSEQLQIVIDYYSTHNWYNLIANNCAELASKSWNKAFDDDLDAKSITWLPSKLKDSIGKRSGSYTIDFNDEILKERFNQ